MKRLAAVFLPFLTLGLSGCITFLTEIRVNPDGSGTMIQTVSMNPQAMKDAMGAVAKGMGGSGEVKESKTEETKSEATGPFRREDLAEKAKDMGEGVTIESVDKIDSPSTAGVRVTYKFLDINKLSVNPKPSAAMGTEQSGASARGAAKFRFERKGDRSILTVLLPRDRTKEAPASPPPPNPDFDEQQLAMFKQMMKGLHIGLAVEVNGRLIQTTSRFRSGNRVTLFDVDFDPLLDQPETLKTLNARLGAVMGDDTKTAEVLADMPGLKVDPQPEVRIEFSGR